MDTSWAPDLSAESGPKYLALSRALRDAIGSGALVEGGQLPTVRDLAWRIGVTPGTVSRAYQIATQEGLLQATVGRGTFVAARSPRLGPTQPLFMERDPGVAQGRVDLRSPHLPDVGQGAIFTVALRRMADRIGRDWLDYTSQTGEAALREAVCDWMSDRDLGPITAQDVMLTHGGQNGIGLVLNCCLRGDRPVVLTEDLGYPGFRYAARLARAEVVGVDLDHEGIRPDALEAACRKHGPQVLFLTPETQNPTTARMSLERRMQVVAIARAHGLQIIEDECYTVPATDAPTLRALAPERVWYAGSISKTVSAALRFGYVICPTGMGETGRLTAQHGFFALSQPVAELCLDLFTSGAARDIREAVRLEVAERLQLMVNRLGAYDLHWQPGLPFAWLNLPQGWRSSSFARAAQDEGVLLRSADQYALNTGRAPNAVRMAVPGGIPQAQYEAGLVVLARMLGQPPSDMAV